MSCTTASRVKTTCDVNGPKDAPLQSCDGMRRFIPLIFRCSCVAGADEGDAAMRRLSDRRRAEVMESNTLPQMQAVMNRV